MKNYFKRLLLKDKKKKFVYTTRELAKGSDSNGEMVRNPQMFHTLGDLAYSSTGSSVWINSSIPGVSIQATNVTNLPSPKVERTAVKPIEVFNEIKKEDIEIDFKNLDEKIKVVEERLKVLSEHLSEEHLKDEYQALFYLKNRKKYTEGKYNFEWAITNQEAMDDLFGNFFFVLGAWDDEVEVVDEIIYYGR